eukprot:NODE_3565_length_391_cov_205.973684_g3013_i0.p3 GENE.NODE_3565_length_391_cov_205.973684_g3013_i0~~NODE_3565_length_391_cov_205.973684_g3013_i0.p3  ORF type:complete len:59 (+),score=35.53 NODE_3565_length_391_cov_205.973684_g3013_i0:211-387(+)
MQLVVTFNFVTKLPYRSHTTAVAHENGFDLFFDCSAMTDQKKKKKRNKKKKKKKKTLR